jgi:hypothetical protein
MRIEYKITLGPQASMRNKYMIDEGILIGFVYALLQPSLSHSMSIISSSQ